jgi:DNA repair exonuclease SbcCD ATPase subunit
MKTVKINSFQIQNFMGVESYSRAGLAEKSWKVSGGNGIGKSTLEKALRWCLNIHVADEIKPRDEQNHEIPDLTTSVSFTFFVDDEAYTVKKVCTDKTNKKGVKTGNDFKYYVGVTDWSKNEFNEQISRLFGVPSDVLKVLMTPFGFAAVNWKVLRDILTDTLPNSSDTDWMERSKYTHLIKYVENGIGLEKAISGAEKQGRAFNKRLEILKAAKEHTAPVKPECEKPTPEQTQKSLKAVKVIEKKVIEHKAGAGFASDIAENETEITRLQNEIRKAEQQHLKAAWDLQQEKIQEEEKRRILAQEQAKRKDAVSQLKIANGQLKQDLQTLKAAPTVDTICSLCKQAIPEADVNKVRMQANQAQVEAIRSINTAGQQNGKDIKEHEAAIKRIDLEITTCTDRIKALEEQKNALGQPHENEKKGIQDTITALEADVKHLQKTANSDLALLELEGELKAAHTAKECLSQNALAWENYDKLLKAAQDTTEQKTLSKQLSEADGLAASLREASMAKNTAIEFGLNQQLKYIQIKLFQKPMDGETKETCKVLVNGIEAGLGLNTAGQINADLDVKDLLMKSYGVSLPVFIDTAESITEPLPLDTQCFYLEVKKGVNELAWETV